MRLLWIGRVAWAAFAGAIVRVSRRLLGNRPRIWHGPLPLHAISYMVAADRLAGYPSRSCVLSAKQIKQYDLVTRADFDRVIESDEEVAWYDRHWLALIDLLRRGDIWVTYFDGLFFNVVNATRNEAAFRLIRLVGIRIVVTAHGSDILQLTRRRTRYDWIARMQLDYPSWSFAEQSLISLKRIELFCRHSDLVLPGDAVMARLLPRGDVMFKPFPIDCDALRPGEFVARETVRIFHAPNHRNVKGTDFLMAAVEVLIAKGFPCELVLIERVARNEALKRYAEADIIADQFCMGAWAQFALEGMALAKPVLCYLDQEHLGDPVFNLPVVNGVPEILEPVLAALIAVPELRRRLGAASRSAVERYQSIPALADVWDRIYRHVWDGKVLDFEGTMHFSSERRSRSFSEDPIDPEFWPVEVSDLMPLITAAVHRLRES